MPRTVRLLALITTLALFASACGSTVRQTGAAEMAVAQDQVGGQPDLNAGLAAPGDDGLAAPAAPGTTSSSGTGSSPPGSSAPRPTGATASSGAAGSSSPGGTTAAPAGSDTTSAGGGPAAGAQTPATGAQAQPAVQAAGPASDEPIKVGFTYLEGATNVMNSLGTEVSFGDGRLQAQAMVDAVNAAGGIDGRMLEAHFAGVNVATADPETAFNAACTELTEDAGVFVIMNPINPTQSFVACAAAHSTLLINGSFNPGDDALYQQFADWFFSPSLLSLDRGASLMIDTLQAEGAFDDPLVKVGIMYIGADPQNGRVVERTMQPLLDALGVNYVVAEASDTSTVSAAQLRFAAEGVTLVMFVAPNGIGQLLFMQAAENQLYRPDYFTTDSDSTRFVSENAPRAQAEHIRGVGTLPIANVPVQSHPTTPREQECLDIIRQGGEDNTDRLTNLTATIYCEMVNIFQAVGAQAGATLTADTFRQAYRTLGTSYSPVTTFSIDFSSGRNDNTTQYRSYAWDPGCSCIAYTSPSTPIPG